MSESLAVKYRPKEFADVCSQASVIKILNRQIELTEFKNCYLFSGHSGTGKTTMARIFANKINRGMGRPIEIDAASNNGVDNIRDIVASAHERSIDSEYKIIILDECHVLTNQAWQAFLKCLEEPPKYTIFILCTTDPQKIPLTVMNRVMRFNFTRIKPDVIKSRLDYICESEQFINYTETNEYISKISEGSMRTAISYLDKVASFSKDVNIDNTLNALGNYSYNMFFTLINNIIDGKQAEVLNILSDFYNEGMDLRLFVDQFFNFCVDLLKYVFSRNFSAIKIPASMQDKLNMSIGIQDADKYYSYYVNKLLGLKSTIKYDINPMSSIEVVLLQMCALQ